ncbi:hypothetical protein HXX76_012548 [Chlamydomonas incerta]|uniref:Dihydroxyacetone kinase n=1 Tax=Chlamydomonas incerta TaxID=51695 RepID=A0A835SSA9_CHLIN|nr:hypothetical protein HXX76_012548 [Chlamydomonas incerta]|eukprot:KAG2427354.1 hypothetical protein HXX76_012548 [Chlamydomonas incerta]
MLINSPDTVVVDALEGLCLTNAHLQRLEGSPQIKVVINKFHDKCKVALISGGGSGHEPAHAGYVGEGMLAAAVCGDVFASPSTAAVLAAIRAVTGPAGCLLIVKNYTGDRLNFGLAAEQALGEGYAVEVVVVGEDVAIDAPSRLTGRRGLAGTVLVHKAAGAAAARGAPLSEVAAVAARVSDHLATLGVGLSPCTLPGKPTPERLAADEIEIGLGIHGEPGRAAVRPPPPAAELVTRMVAQIASGSPFFKLPPPAPSAGSPAGPSSPGAPRLVLLVNNLGATPPLELSLVAGAALRAVRRDLGAAVDRVYVGPFMTSLDMAGMSLTLLSYDMDPEAAVDSQSNTDGAAASSGSGSGSGSGKDAAWAHLLELLDAPTAAPGWPYRGPALPAPYDPATLADVPAPLPVAKAGPGGGDAMPPLPAGGLSAAGAALGRALRAAAGAVVAAEAELDEMDAKVGDGDCGATLAGGGRAVLAALDAGAVPLHCAPAAAAAVAAAVRGCVGGSSGALYDILLTAAARQLKASTQLDASPRDWAEALSAGLAAVQKYGRADTGCRTMLDALLPARDAALAAAERGEGGAAAAEAAAAAAEAGAESTRGMAAAAGRASYVPAEVLATVPDPGAVAAARWLRAVATALKQ